MKYLKWQPDKKGFPRTPEGYIDIFAVTTHNEPIPLLDYADRIATNEHIHVISFHDY